MKALVLGDEQDARANISLALRLRWPDAELAVAEAPRHARRMLADYPLDVLFVSATHPDFDALSLVQKFREDSDIVIFVIGSSCEDMETVEALEAGADDYLSMPISASLLVARVCAALRRARQVTAEERPAVKCGELVIDPENHEARLNGRPLYLTPTEFKLLYHLAQHQGRLVTQQALEDTVWGSSDRLYIDVLRKHVQRLRQKLEAPRRGRMTITTIPRVGYKLALKNGTSSRR